MGSRRTFGIAAALLIALAGSPRAQQQQIVVQGSNVDIRMIGEDLPPELAALLGRGGAPMGVGTGIVVGQAFEASTGQPIPGALVTLGLPGVSPLRVLADSQGRFAFRSLPAGRFSLSATKAGFVDGAFGRRRPSGPTQPIDLSEGERQVAANVPLWRYSALTGVVLDERGDPVVGATVQALVRTTVAGMPKLATGPIDQTDDRGIYRIGMLEPGDYVVVLPSGREGQTFTIDGLGGAGGFRSALTFTASVASGNTRMGPNGVPTFDRTEELVGPAGLAPDGTPLTYQTLFYPAATTPTRAATVRLGSGEERAGVDFERRPVPSGRVTGMVMGPDGPAPNQRLNLIPAGSEELTSPVGSETVSSDAEGRFEFNHVAPGPYTLRVSQSPRIRLGGGGDQDVVSTGGGGTFVMRTAVRIGGVGGAAPPLPDEPSYWAEVPVAVSGHVDVPVTLSAGVRVKGQVAFAGQTARPSNNQLPAIRLALDPADGRTSALEINLRGRIEESGQFRTVTVPPGKYFVRADGLPEGWYFKGATLGGRDVTDAPLTVEAEEITGVTLLFTDQQTQLTGSVTDPDNGDQGALVIVFPADRSGWINYGTRPRRIRSTRVSDTGAFTFNGLPPGEYLVAAVRDEGAGDWQRADFLDAVSNQATRVRLGDGEQQNQSLRVVR